MGTISMRGLLIPINEHACGNGGGGRGKGWRFDKIPCHVELILTLITHLKARF